MKTYNKIFWALFSVFLLVSVSCSKEKIKDIDFDKYNDDDPQTDTELDKWLTTNFLDEYNIKVIYRYNRYYHDVERNVTPPRLDAVRPTMTSVLDGYLKPYRKVAGDAFIKNMSPKEWILFGSVSIASDGTAYAGTASAGRRVNLYGINNYQPYSALRVIHHEFVHILNQLVAIPSDFEIISKQDYKATWDQTPADTAKKYGFVTSYASGSYTEDYAETASHLLVNGQAWYDRYANSSSEYGKKNLKLKEQNVEGYFNDKLNVDFRELQMEIQKYLRTTANPADLRFAPYLQSVYKSFRINLQSDLYTKYGISQQFRSAYEAMKQGILDYSSSAKYNMDYMQLRFDSSDQATVRLAFTAAAGGTQYVADYTFGYVYNASTGKIEFTKIDQAGTDGSYSNANLFMSDFITTLQPYLEGTSFIADWLRKDVEGADFNNLAGFYEEGNESNYFYGVLGQTL